MCEKNFVPKSKRPLREGEKGKKCLLERQGKEKEEGEKKKGNTWVCEEERKNKIMMMCAMDAHGGENVKRKEETVSGVKYAKSKRLLELLKEITGHVQCNLRCVFLMLENKCTSGEGSPWVNRCKLLEQLVYNNSLLQIWIQDKDSHYYCCYSLIETSDPMLQVQEKEEE